MNKEAADLKHSRPDLKGSLRRLANSVREWLRRQPLFRRSEGEGRGSVFERSKEAGSWRTSPFGVLVRKEISDHIRSWRFMLLLGIILLTCIASLYTAMNSIQEAIHSDSSANEFVILKLFTLSDGTLPSFISFIGFLGPLLGIGLGFDAVNSERNKGTLSRIMAQPLHRDALLNAKFVASLSVISMMFLMLGFLIMALGTIILGIPPTLEEFLRMISFIFIIIFYIGFWLNLSILFSVRFRQPATSALSGISVWLFFSFFYDMILNIVSKGIAPNAGTATVEDIVGFQNQMLWLSRISPYTLFNEATTTLLMPSVRNLGPLTTEQVYGAIASPLPFGQSLLLVWPQVTGLIALTLICFALSYVLFLRQEIRGRS
ncbi:ABC transporter permease [Paenibacillus woosongensis]|uniref:ABC transporter permease n=1 Tax=Paenibacillus woosongensis TaxID=307580 RepID=A0ABQ4MN95_9BACL|nr:ABC transporter permease [Paenibacillus woosongensis]GIP57455.1 ABC transporter permease [Paenibacillus woosongensis]